MPSSSPTELSGLAGGSLLYVVAFAAPLIVVAYVKVPKLLSTLAFKSFSGTTFEILRLLFREGWSSNRSLVLGFAVRGALALSFHFADSFVPIQLGRVVDRLGKSASGSFPWGDVLIFAGLQLMVARPTFGLLGAISYQQEAVILLITQAVYRHIMSLSADYHDAASATELMRRLDRLAFCMQMGYMILFGSIPRVLGVIFVAANLAATFGPAFAVLFAGTVASYAYIEWSDASWWIGSLIAADDVSARERRVLVGALSNWSTVSYFNRIKYEEKRYADVSLERHTQAAKRSGQIEAKRSLEQLVLALGWVCVTAMAIYQIRYHGRSAGDFVMVTAFWSTIASHFERLSIIVANFQSFLGDIHQVMGLLALRPTLRDKEGAVDLDCKRGAVTFDHVGFSYDKHKDAVRNTSFHVEGGCTVALVGETGGGKSTIVKLLTRRYDVSSGSIKIDGQDLRDLRLESLREQIAIVPQEIAIFPETVLFNIRYGNLAASQEQVEDACRAAAIHDQILTWPDGYQTQIGETGKRLSGGEMQRLAIARMLVKKDAKIIVMDEAMSSLDSETDWTIQKSLRRWTSGKTVVMIAHRLSTIAHSDHILVVKGGQIIEAGRQKELIEKKGHYYSMWVKQNESLEAGDDMIL